MISPQIARMMISNLTQDPEILAAVDLVLAPESKIEFRHMPHDGSSISVSGKKCYHAIAEKDGRKVEAWLVL